MTKWNRSEIQSRARKELEAASSGGIRYMELANKIHAAAPETPFNSVVGALHDFSLKSQDIVRPSRGLWLLKKFAEKEASDSSVQPAVASPSTVEEKAQKSTEDQLYEPFAQWLVGEDEAIETMVVGGNAFKSKWATPDVIGTYKPKKSDPVQFPIELISAEVKIDDSQSIIAFGQACAYRLFSHKTFIVMPNTIGKNDVNRLDALCVLYGMGLVLFDPKSDAPKFEMVLRAQRLEPDVFFLNDFVRRLRDSNQKEFDRLFG